MSFRRIALGLGVALLSAGVLKVELLLTRLFSVVLYYHFAFMGVAVALLGMGAGGLLVYLNRRRFPPERLAAWLTGLGLLLTTGILLTLILILHTQLGLELYLTDLLRPLFIFGLASVPFFFAGAMLSLVLWHFSESVHRIYFYDLVGAAIGSIAVLPALEWLGAPRAMLLAALLAAGSTVLLGLATGASRSLRAAGLGSVLVVALLLGLNVRSNWLDLRYAKGISTRVELYARWNAISRVCVHREGGSVVIKIDCDAATQIATYDFAKGVPAEVKREFSRGGEALAYVLRPGAKTLIIGSGGGVDVARALAHGSQRVVAVEINPLIAEDLMLGRFREYSHGLFSRPEVELIVDDARSTIRRSSEQFEVMQATLIDTWASTAAGAFALSENFLYTTEAFEEYLQHLSPQGILTVTRWEFSPPRQAIRLASLARAALEKMGAVRPADHFVVIGDSERGVVSVLVKHSSFTPDELAEVRRFVADRPALQAVFLPDSRAENEFSALLRAPDLDAFTSRYPFDISPVGDDRPFFFFTTRWGRLLTVYLAPWEDLKNNLALFLLAVTLAITGVAALGFMALPRWFEGGEQGRWAPRSLWTYFLAIGLAYMITEIALIQKFILFLGHPTYGVVVVVFSLLVGSGIGSRWSGRLQNPERLIVFVPMLLALALSILHLIALPGLLPLGMPMSRLLRGVMSVLLLFPVAFVMGMPFPTGVRLARGGEGDLVPWLWSANAAGSVMGSVLAMLLAITFGIPVAGVFGATCYVGAAVAAYAYARRTGQGVLAP